MRRRWLYFFTWIFLTGHLILFPVYASEVIEETRTRVVVREHPKTGRPYVSIVSSESPNPEDPFARQRKKYSRPNYRMLDPKVKSREIPYDGPWSDRKKVYLFAASIATVGTVGGAMALAATPVATGTAASGGAGAYLAAGTAVTAAPVAVAAVAHRSEDPHKDDYQQESSSRLSKTETLR